MYFSAVDIQQFDADMLHNFLEKRIPEGPHLDYKRELSGNNDDTKHREFIKDISAFANARGGTILLGIDEPDDETETEDQIFGIEDANAVARKLERVATNIDPRIPSLVITAIKHSANKSIIIAHIPPSNAKPHMAIYQKVRSFYIRHSESSVPMDTQEIRDAIIMSISNEERIRSHIRKKRKQLQKYYTTTDRPAFIVQAIPIISPAETWEERREEYKQILKGEGRRGDYHQSWNLVPNTLPQLGLGNVNVTRKINGEIPPVWKLEIADSGQVSIVLNVIEIPCNKYAQPDDADYDEAYLITPQLYDFIRAFCEIVSLSKQVTRTDSSYLFACRLVHAKNAKHDIGDLEAPLHQEFDVLRWPESILLPDASHEEVANSIIEQSKNAFGLE